MPSPSPMRPAASSAVSAGSCSSKSVSTPAGTWGRGATLGRRGPGSPSTSAAIRSKRTAWRTSSRRLQEEDPSHQGLIKRHRGLLGGRGKRCQLLGHGILGHAETGQEPGQSLTALSRQLGPCPGIRSQIDGRRIPLQTTHDPGEETGPVTGSCKHVSLPPCLVAGHDGLARPAAGQRCGGGSGDVRSCQTVCPAVSRTRSGVPAGRTRHRARRLRPRASPSVAKDPGLCN